MCDFGSGFREPEMVKKRPVVVVSPKRRNSTTCIVVPLSTVEPLVIEPFHHRMDPASLPRSLRMEPTWVKGDMLTHVALDRLDRARYRSSVTGARCFETTECTPVDWEAIQRCLRAALGLQ